MDKKTWTYLTLDVLNYATKLARDQGTNSQMILLLEGSSLSCSGAIKVDLG